MIEREFKGGGVGLVVFFEYSLRKEMESWKREIVY